jgi:hypothetical protein
MLLGWSREVDTFNDPLFQFADGDPVLWVALKDHAKNLVQLIGQW